jgi:RNA polymerase sigma factor (sigma-70 family)
MIISGSLDIDLREETNRRLEHLYVSHSKWLESVSFKITKDKNQSEELIGELYLYLAERPNPNLWYATSFNLMYLRSFIHSRFINSKKRDNKMSSLSEYNDVPYEEYDEEGDDRFEQCWNMMMDELESLKKQKGWSSAKLFELYYFGDTTLEKLSSEVGISLSTTFMNVKKTKEHLKKTLPNPFKRD